MAGRLVIAVCRPTASDAGRSAAARMETRPRSWAWCVDGSTCDYRAAGLITTGRPVGDEPERSEQPVERLARGGLERQQRPAGQIGLDQAHPEERGLDRDRVRPAAEVRQHQRQPAFVPAPRRIPVPGPRGRA
jgi:hypothetical protein